MSFLTELEKFRAFDYADFFGSITQCDIEAVLMKDRLNELDFLTLLSPLAENHLEAVAQKAHQMSVRQFGKTMQLFTPMYISNFCVNHCVYCGFNCRNNLQRRKLSFAEIREEGAQIAKTGLKHVLVLTGESSVHSPLDYILSAIKILKEFFTGIGIEIYPLTDEGYQCAADAGVDAVTMFQEVYNEAVYERLHPAGPKRDFAFRLDAPERACRAGLRGVNIGALLGLDDWRKEAFLTGLHADYLQRKYSEVEIAVSTPRMRPHAGNFSPPVDVTDRNIVQYILAYRLFMPRSGITLSSRERPMFRDALVRLGVTKMSGGVTTAVGGHSRQGEQGQFTISDERSVSEMAQMLYGQGYQPVYKDWQAV